MQTIASNLMQRFVVKAEVIPKSYSKMAPNFENRGSMSDPNNIAGNTTALNTVIFIGTNTDMFTGTRSDLRE